MLLLNNTKFCQHLSVASLLSANDAEGIWRAPNLQGQNVFVWGAGERFSY